MERYFDVDLNGYRDAILHRRVESPATNRLNGLLVESQAERPCHPDVPRQAFRVYNQHQNTCTPIPLLASSFRVFGVRSRNGPGRTDAAAHAINPAAGPLPT